MAVPALTSTLLDVWTRRPANDNDSRPGDTEGDRWRWLIEHLKTIDTPIAVFAAQSRLRGMRCEDFCLLVLDGAKLAGWECVQDLDA